MPLSSDEVSEVEQIVRRVIENQGLDREARDKITREPRDKINKAIRESIHTPEEEDFSAQHKDIARSVFDGFQTNFTKAFHASIRRKIRAARHLLKAGKITKADGELAEALKMYRTQTYTEKFSSNVSFDHSGSLFIGENRD